MGCQEAIGREEFGGTPVVFAVGEGGTHRGIYGKKFLLFFLGAKYLIYLTFISSIATIPSRGYKRSNSRTGIGDRVGRHAASRRS